MPDAEARPPIMLTVPQAARALQIREETIRALIRTGEIPAKHFGDRGIRISRLALEEWARVPADYREPVKSAAE